MNNKNLALVFGALLAIYLLSKLFGGNRERSFDPTIVQIDTSQVTRIEVQPSQQGSPFSLKKSGGSWTVSSGSRSYTATPSAVRSLLSNLSLIEAERVVSKNPDKYLDYGLDDDARTSLSIFDGSKKLGGVEVGRFNYNQATRNGISYIRRSDAPEVFSVEGFLSMSLNQAMDNYRDKLLVKTNRQDLTRISFQSPERELSYSLNGNAWVDTDNLPVDSTTMMQYLNALSSVSGGHFADDETAIGEPRGRLTIEGNNMNGPIEVQCYASRDTSHHFVIASSTNTEGKFFSDSSGIYSRLIGNLLDIPSAE
ncbi:MAG: DUF4340 domain-containing protein [Saprospiraceae bacterium]|nr:DUF4340 domain-containing protein [Saprospiraceae bacterium]